jgi:hypothetical protein
VQLQAISAPLVARLGDTGRRTVWIALFSLGLCFWIPALLRAKLGASAVLENSAVDAPTSSDAVSRGAVAEAPATILSPLSTSGGRPVAALRSKLVLTTTILGKTRRAAIVNGRLYREGDKIVAGSELYRLAGVGEDRIDLVALAPSAGSKRSVMLKPAPEPDRDPSGSH